MLSGEDHSFRLANQKYAVYMVVIFDDNSLSSLVFEPFHLRYPNVSIRRDQTLATTQIKMPVHSHLLREA